MIKFICKGCNYRFKSENQRVVKCPYCGEAKVIKEPNAEELLKQAGD